MKRTTAIVWTLGILMLVAVSLLMLHSGLGQARSEWLFSEAGPFERLSEALWLAAALAAALMLRPLRWRVFSVSLVFLLLGAREADLHKAFTRDSVTKINYFLNGDYPLGERILAGLTLLAIVALAVDLLIAAIRFARENEFFAHAWSCVTVLAVGLLVALKVLDRTKSLLYEKFAIELAPVVARGIGPLEEGLECAMPLVFVFVLVLARQSRISEGCQPRPAMPPAPSAAPREATVRAAPEGAR